jgi:F-type H+-transporting ATPase subunit a
VSARTLLIAVGVIVVALVGAIYFPVTLPHVQLPAEAIGHVGPFTITNTILTGWISSLVVLGLFWAGTSNAQVVPRGIQNFVEYISEFVLSLCESVAGVRRGREFFPLVGTIFFFVIVSNWMGLLPGFSTIGFWETPHAAPAAGAVVDTHAEDATKSKEPSKEPATKEKAKAAQAKEPTAKDKVGAAEGDHAEEHPILVPLFRAASSDLNTTLAIALVSVIFTQIVGLRHLGGEYVSRFFNFKGGPIGFYVGVLELIAEFAKIISFTFRLFGNVFAGEVLIAVITFLLPWVVVLPFYGLELFVGFIQAFVFAVLTLVFMSLATESHAEHGEPGGAAHH